MLLMLLYASAYATRACLPRYASVAADADVVLLLRHTRAAAQQRKYMRCYFFTTVFFAVLPLR